MAPHKCETAETEGVHSEWSTARSSSSIERVPLTAKELCTNRDAALGGTREEAQILKVVMDEAMVAPTLYTIPLLLQQSDGSSEQSEIMSLEGIASTNTELRTNREALPGDLQENMQILEEASDEYWCHRPCMGARLRCRAVRDNVLVLRASGSSFVVMIS